MPPHKSRRSVIPENHQPACSARYWVRLHIVGMGLSYILMLVAFYADNGKQLPLWKDLPHFMYWLIPMAVGIPLIVRALLWPPLARARAGIST